MKYISPLSERYSSQAMQELFSSKHRAITMRKLWTVLASCQQKLGLDITDEQLSQLRDNIENVNLEAVAKYEAITRHDIMAHIHAYGDVAPKAKSIIHMGATSCFVGDNADLIIYNEAMQLIKTKLAVIIKQLSNFAMQYKSLPTLGMTHLQSAQPTTVGKRATLWLANFVDDYNDLQYLLTDYRLRGVKGTTGTQASFLELFGDSDKVFELDKMVASELGYDNVFGVTGQTYPRKFDYKLLAMLSSIAQSASKFAVDMRLLQSFGELEEPFERNQVGSSAMAYKRNPMRCERICSISRFVMNMPSNASDTASNQWLERTLDDSANKRLAVTEAFLALDGILDLLINVSNGIVVYDKVIAKRLDAELPFMTTEKIIMLCCKANLSRQDAHERIREHSMTARLNVKRDGLNNNLIDLILADEFFAPVATELHDLLDAKLYIGLADKQVDYYIAEYAQSIIDSLGDTVVSAEIKV